MILKDRIDLLCKLGDYMLSESTEWNAAKEKAFSENGWFIPEFIELAIKNISENFLKREKLTAWISHYNAQARETDAKTIGIVMAGNIPLVGFHDFISGFVTGHRMLIKPSSKDKVLIRHLTEVLANWESAVNDCVHFAEILKNCDAYIATGSNNTSRYFEYYFGKYPHVIRRNKTSVAILDGGETDKELKNLADDVYQFFGLGCRNVTKIYIPQGYDFQPLLSAFTKYNYLADHHKYKNNYDYNLALHILNNKFYMTNGSLLLSEDKSAFSPISQLNYEYYTDRNALLSRATDNDDIQCVVGQYEIPFGESQSPTLFAYADKIDTMAFLRSL